MSEQVGKPAEMDLDWVQLHKEMAVVSVPDETLKEKFDRKFLGNPLVPIGMFATCCALGFGLRSMMKGTKMTSQYMMRARVLAQGFTIAVAVGSIGVAANRIKQEKIPEQPNEEMKAE